MIGQETLDKESDADSIGGDSASLHVVVERQAISRTVHVTVYYTSTVLASNLPAHIVDQHQQRVQTLFQRMCIKNAAKM